MKTFCKIKKDNKSIRPPGKRETFKEDKQNKENKRNARAPTNASGADLYPRKSQVQAPF